MSSFLAAVLLAVLPVSAPALVRHYAASQEFRPGEIHADLPALVEIELAIWESDTERVLIGGGMSIATISPNGSLGSIRWNMRKMISEDIVSFEDKDGTATVLFNDTLNPQQGMLVTLNYKSRLIEFVLAQYDFAGRALSIERVTTDANYRPSRLMAQQVAVETGNPPVNFHVFFKSKQSGFFKPSAAPSAAATSPTIGELFLPPQPGTPEWNRLSKKERKRLKQQHKALQTAAEKPAAKTGSSSTWLTASPAPAYKLPPPKRVAITGFDTQIEALLARPDKPELSDMIAFMQEAEAAGHDMKVNPFEPFLLRGTYSVEAGLSRMDEVYRKLETAFPGATWYLLGRDVYLLNDALEAYYLARGEGGRVVRLPASQPSFRDATQDLIDGFLKTYGLDVDKIGPDSRPQVILDISSYSSSTFRLSQSRQLMRAAYQRWKDLGRDPRDLMRKVNFVNVSETHIHEEVESAAQVERFFKTLTFGPEPLKILSADAPSAFLYTDTWHGLYTPFKKLDDGRVVTGFDPNFSRTVRLSMLAELWTIVSHYGLEHLSRCAAQLKKE